MAVGKPQDDAWETLRDALVTEPVLSSFNVNLQKKKVNKMTTFKFELDRLRPDFTNEKVDV